MASRWVTTTPWALVGLFSCQRSVSRLDATREHRARIELASPRYDGGILPLDEQCISLCCSVGSEGLEPSPPWLRATYAAANTLIPFVVVLCQQPVWELNPSLRLERAVSCSDRRTGRVVVSAYLSRSGLGGARILVSWASTRC